MFECKKAHGSAADMGHRVLMYLRGRDELQHRGWALRAWLTKTIEPKGKEALVSGQGSIVPITVGTQPMDV